MDESSLLMDESSILIDGGRSLFTDDGRLLFTDGWRSFYTDGERPLLEEEIEPPSRGGVLALECTEIRLQSCDIACAAGDS